MSSFRNDEPVDARSEPFARLAEKHGTPAYVYDARTVFERIARVREAFGHELGLLYAVKANPLPALLEAIRPVVDGLDVASEGEVDRALATGYAPDQLRLAGPGKNAALLQRAVGLALPISVESPEELADIISLARTRSRPAPVYLRLEPRTPRRGFAVQMGHPVHPFGLDAEETRAALMLLKESSGTIDLRGIHVYAGTQCRSVRAWLEHLAEVLDLAQSVLEAGVSLPEINVGGGFGVATDEAAELDVATLGPKARRMLAKFPPGPRYALELGRYLVADAGVYLTRVLRIKRRGHHRVAVLDGGVHHLWAASGRMGPPPSPIAVPSRSGRGPTHLMGPLCTPLDHLGQIAAEPEPGDVVLFRRAGAYGATLSPVHFLGHGPPKEIWWDGDLCAATPATAPPAPSER